MRNHMKMMWMCVVVAVIVAVGVAVAGLDVGFGVLLVLPCVVMMGAMAWMMVRMARHGGGHPGR